MGLLLSDLGHIRGQIQASWAGSVNAGTQGNIKGLDQLFFSLLFPSVRFAVVTFARIPVWSGSGCGFQSTLAVAM